MSENLMTARYSRLSMILHWLMLALFVGVYGCIEIKGLLPNQMTFAVGLAKLFSSSCMAL